MQKSTKLRFSTDAVTNFAQKRYAVFFFILFAFAIISLNNLICGYNPFTLSPEVNPRTYQFYVCDYSCGFVSRVLIGAIVTLFTDTVTVQLIGVITCVALLLSLILSSVFIGIGLTRAIKKKNIICLFLCLSALAFPYISVWSSDCYGMLDVFLMICFLFAAFSENGFLRVFIPALMCGIGLCIHYCFMFEFAPAILCVLFYHIFYGREGKNIKITVVGFTLAAVITAGLFIWFSVFANNHLLCTADEFNTLMSSRFVLPDDEREFIEKYYEWYITQNNFSEAQLPAVKEELYRDMTVFTPYFNYYIFNLGNDAAHQGLSDYIKIILAESEVYRDTPRLIRFLLLSSPFLFFSLINSCKRFITEKGAGKLPFIAVFAASLQLIPALILSTDVYRFVTSAVISALYMNYMIEYDTPCLRLSDPKYKKFIPIFSGSLLAVIWVTSVVFIRKYEML